MLLVAAATGMELASVREHLGPHRAVELFCCGVGPVEAAVRIGERLAAGPVVRGVLLTGVAGAYPTGGLDLLDLCLAREEVLGDLGICLADRIDRFEDPRLEVVDRFCADPGFLARATAVLERAGLASRSGCLVTVSCASGTAARGGWLRQAHQALAENMEGAAVARACLGRGIPWLELRCVSNLVEDRDPERWQLAPACQKAGRAAALVAQALAGDLENPG